MQDEKIEINRCCTLNVGDMVLLDHCWRKVTRIVEGQIWCRANTGGYAKKIGVNSQAFAQIVRKVEKPKTIKSKTNSI